MLHPKVFGFGTDVWDPSHRFETSWLLTPWILFVLRAAIALYAFVVLFVRIVYVSLSASYGGTLEAGHQFSYFTVLCYWGIAFYFLFASIHTFTYARSGSPLLNRWPRPLQALHSLYYTTIITYPILVSIIFWGFLFSAWWPDMYSRWSNISVHAMNSLFCLCELLLTRTNSPPWIHLPWLIVLLASYLGLAYLTKHTEGFYVYSFLDPGVNGIHKTKVVGYVFGILAAIIVVFSLVKGAVWLRKWVTEKKMDRMGRFHGGRGIQHGEVELEATRPWEK